MWRPRRRSLPSSGADAADPVAVFTKRLGVGATGAANTPVTAYTCPAGQTAILKDIRLSTGSGSAVNAIVFGVSGSSTCLFLVRAVAASTAESAQPYVVLGPGDQVKVQCNVAGALEFWLSGSELDGVT